MAWNQAGSSTAAPIAHRKPELKAFETGPSGIIAVAFVNLVKEGQLSVGGAEHSGTRILNRVEQGDPKAAQEWLPLVYAALRRLAAQKMAEESHGQPYPFGVGRHNVGTWSLDGPHRRA
jgi:hypothetical protein